MSLNPLNLAMSLVAIVIMTTTVHRLRRRDVSLRASLLWLVVWLGVIVTALFPVWVDVIIALTGWGVRVNVILVLAVVALIASMTQLHARLERIERNVARNVQEMALHDYRLGRHDGEALTGDSTSVDR